MKVLIAVVTCHHNRPRADACRRLWASDTQGADVRFFMGRHHDPTRNFPREDEVWLDAPDNYDGLPQKVRAMMRWALDHGYDYVFKTDDDVYLRLERLLTSGFEQHDYSGRLRGPSGNLPAPYASGLGYWVSQKAARLLSEAPTDGHQAEDRWAGNVLLSAGIACHPDYRYAVVQSHRSGISHTEGPRKGNSIIAACEYEPQEMEVLHQEFLHKPANVSRDQILEGPLNRVAILIKTFLRDGYLSKCLLSIQQQLPDAKIVLVDDGRENRHKINLYAKLRRQGHSCIWLPFDSGFGAKANAGIPYCDRDYVLIGSDDFDFTDARDGILKMVDVLDACPDIGLVSGRVNDNPYEGVWDWPEPDVLRERFGYHAEGNANGVPYKLCDITVNYSLIRRKVLDAVKWDGGEVKIGGGEHGAFFLDVKRAGWQVAWVPGVSIKPFPSNVAQWQDPAYPSMRARARQPGRLCMRKRGVRKYALFNGMVEKC